MGLTANAIVFDRLTKYYGKRRGLNELTLAIPEGSITAILGPNGAGKSTMMRIIAGMTVPDQGTVNVFGRQPGWERNHLIAYLPDRARWYGGHTVADALEWGERLLPGFNRDRAHQLASDFKLDVELEVEGMSRGQEARLMLVLCLARDVPLLVLDEPFSGIDMISREQIVLSLIDAFSERKQTVLISTHEIGETESLFDYAVFIQDGRAVLCGEVEELRAQRGSMRDIYRQLFGD
ncbi:ABC transporter ATP-binding protein [Anoxybacillus sediminis]|nr:ABC transporter ATP-binding protein [Brevibacillus sp. MCWH]UFJ60052.1 ABC transporter ATP-binding protein [Anoxybacillus sediminis]